MVAAVPERVGARVWRIGTDLVALNAVLVIGDERALLVDTGGGPRSAAAIHGVVRGLTGLPLVVVNTHDHWDHWFGNGWFATHGVTDLRGPAGVDWRGRARDQWQEALVQEPGLAGEDVLPPAGVVGDGEVIDLGGLGVEARVLAGHTAYDLALVAGDVVITGDLVEEGDDPQLDGSSSVPRWVGSLDVLLATGARRFVPGHGRVVDAAFVADQRAWLSRRPYPPARS